MSICKIQYIQALIHLPIEIPMCILICFSLDNHNSLNNVVEFWYLQVIRYTVHQRVPYILVGMKQDLRKEAEFDGVSHSEGENIAKYIKASRYVGCSAKHDEGVKQVIYLAAREAWNYKPPKPKLKCVIM